jgi:O-antigen/teichoic acid export membrane protein
MMPWVLRALGPLGFGKLAFWQAVVQYLVLFVDYGFYLSATKRIAGSKDEKTSITEVFYVVQACRLIIALICVSGSFVLMVLVPDIRASAGIFAASLVAIVGALLTPLWLFAGVERMGSAALVSALGRLVSLPLLFLFVHHPEDAWRAALINSFGIVLAGIACVYLILRWQLVGPWIAPTRDKIVQAYRESWHYFVTTASASLYSAANPIILGLVTGAAQVGLFSAADRVRSASLTPIGPLFNAYYPVVSRTFIENPPAAKRLIMWLMLIICGGMLLVSAILWLVAPIVVRLLMGQQFEGAVGVLRMMAAVPFVIGINTVAGSLGLLAIGMKKEVSRIILVCGALNIPLLAVLGHAYGATGAAASLLATEALVGVGLTVTLIRHAHAFEVPAR